MTKMQQPRNSATAFMGIYPRKIKTYVHTTTCAWMFIASLWVTDENWKQLKLSFNGWMVKLVYPYHRILLSNKKGIYSTSGKTLKRIKLSEKEANVKVTHCVISFIYHSWNGKNIEMRPEWWLPGVKEGMQVAGKWCDCERATWGSLPWRAWIVSMSISWLWFWTIVLQDVTIRVVRVKQSPQRFFIKSNSSLVNPS